MSTKEVNDSISPLPDSFISKCLTKLERPAGADSVKTELVRRFEQLVLESGITQLVTKFEGETLVQSLKNFGLSADGADTSTLTRHVIGIGISALLDKASDALLKQYAALLVR
jgi:hypothetical protein